MEEYNSMEYEFTPMNEDHEEPQVQPENSQPEKPKKRKAGKTVLFVVIIAVVALLGSVAGSLLTFGISFNRQSEVMEEEDQTAYTLNTYSLPQELKSNDAGKSLTPAQVYEMTVNSVVGITTESTTNVFGQEAVSASAGSGFILSEDGYIITNCHVVKGADTIKIALYSGESLDAVLVGSDVGYDVAVLKVEATDLPAVTVGDSDKLQVGEEVAAIGNPLGELTFTMTNGILSALDREINTDGNPQNMLQTNAAINSGNSGGPLFDMDGNVIGVTTAKYSGSTSSGTTIEGLGFAIPINTALRVAYDLVEHGYVKGEAYLGVTLRSLTTEAASYYGMPLGPRVESMNPGSCAEKGGIQVGDVIIEYNGTRVTNHSALKAALKKNKAGDTVEIKVYRAGAEKTVTVTLDEKPSQAELDAQTQTAQKEQQKQQQQQQSPSAGGFDPYYYFSNPFSFFGN